MEKNKKKENGFTLIELLAVILILGIIALIAIPTVNKVIEQTRKGAAERTIDNYIKAVEQQIIINKIDFDETNDFIDGKYTVEDTKALGVTLKGEYPKSGYILIRQDVVYYLFLNTDNFTIFMNQNGEYIVETHINNIASTTDYFDFEIDSIVERNRKHIPIIASVEAGETYRMKGHIKFELEEKNNAVTDFIVQSPLIPGRYALFHRTYNLSKNKEVDFDVTVQATETIKNTSAIAIDTINLKGKVSITNFTIEKINS